MDNTKVVGIGASAGGFEAIQKLLSNLEPHSDLAFIIAQHLDPSQPSLIVNLLSKSTQIPIKEAQDGEYIELNTIYICPPNKNITVVKNTIMLTPPASKIFPKPSIDTFFASLARDKEENAIGIILSGSGSDGALGIKAIKNAGGITIVQDEKSAKYASMPRASIQTGLVDAILLPATIGREIQSIISAPNIFFVNEDAPKQLDTIYDILIERSDTDFTDYKINTIQRRIHRRMAVNKINNLTEYVEYLKNSNKESKLLYKDLLVIVTSFFRDEEAFESLRSVVADIVTSKHGGESIRIWIPGCATGEEVFSIAMLLHQELLKQEKISIVKVQIFATDISKEAITQARSAKYFKEEVFHIPHALVDNYLIAKDDYYEISKNIRDMVVFSQHDLIKDPPFINLDMLSCRNLLIYFNSTLQKRLFAVFHHALRPKGYLFLGKSESTSGLTNIFATIDSKWKIFQRKETLSAPNLDFLQYYPKRYPSSVKVTEPKLKPVLDKEQIMLNAISVSITRFFAKNYLIIDKDNAIIYTHGEIKQYFDIPLGKMTNDILAFATEEIRIDLRAAIYKSRREQQAITHKISSSAQSNQKYYITVLPMPSSDYFYEALLIMFSEVQNDSGYTPSSNTLLNNEDREALEHELMVIKERLQTTIEELETTNEELQSTNEELQSSNEELRSTNEELETSNEELQSSNEELSTVNDELELKTHDLRLINDDLTNAFRSIEYGVMFVDEALRIRRYTPFMKHIFALRDGDIGNLITSIECKVNLPQLRKHLEHVITKGESKRFELDEQGVRYFCKIEPFYNEHDRISGASIICQDKTEIYKREEELNGYKYELERLVNEKIDEIKNSNFELDEAQKMALMGSWSLDIVHQELRWSDEIFVLFELDKEDFKPSYEFFLSLIHPDDRELVDGVYKQSLENKTPYEVEHRMVLPSKKIKYVREKGNTFYDEEGRAIYSRGIVQDITKEAKLKMSIAKQKEEFGTIFKISKDPVAILDLESRFLDFNDAYMEVTGYTRAELLQTSCIELSIPQDYERAKQVISKVIRKGFVKNFEKSCFAKDGTVMTINMTLSLMPDKKRIIVSAKDMTENKQLRDNLNQLNLNLSNKVKEKLEELRQQEQLLIQQSKLAAMGEMISSIAHQWRQPLNLLSLKKDLLILSYENDELDDTLLIEYNKSVDDTIRYMSKTIDDFRNFFRPSKEKELFDVVQSIYDVVNMINAQLNQQAIKLNIHQESQTIEFFGYPNEFKQVIINLIKNAQDAIATQKVKGIIDINLKSNEECVTIEVQDNAGGVPDEIRSKIFEPYFTTKFQKQGTGLGLYMSKSIIERNMNGRLSVENRNNGALFTILLQKNRQGLMGEG